MATLHLMVGLPCSGKTTLAKELEERHHALRLTPDEWHIKLFGQDYFDDMSEPEEANHGARHDAVESLMWEVAARALTLGVDVVLDFGCWVRSQRDAYRARATALRAQFEIHYLDVPEEVLLERIKVRNAAVSQRSFFIPEVKLRQWLTIFEPPSADELTAARTAP